MKLNRRWLVFLLPIVAVLVPLSAASTGGAASGPSGSLTVWVDAVRLPVAKLYAKTHPNVHLNIVTYDGDGNGSTTMQTKIQLWNRTGNGWPDVIFTEQANDPVWMGSPPFNFAMDLKSVFPAKLLAGWPAPSLGQCTVNGHLVCLQDNLAQEVLYVNKKLMTQFGYTVPTTWQQWAALGKKVATQHPGYIVGNIGDSYGAWLYLWPDKCPISQVVAAEHRPDQRQRRALHAHGEHARSADQERRGSAESVFTADFAQKWGGATDKILLMPGPVWYAKDIFSGTLHVPAGELTAALPLRWGSEPLVTGQVGGGPWVVSNHTKNQAAAHRLRPVGDDLAVGEVKGQCPLAGLSVVRPHGKRMVELAEQGSLLRSSRGPGHEGRRAPRLDGLEHGDLSRSARLVEHGRHGARCREDAELPAARIRQRAPTERAGGGIQGCSDVARELVFRHAELRGGHATAWPPQPAGPGVRPALPAAPDRLRRRADDLRARPRVHQRRGQLGRLPQLRADVPRLPLHPSVQARPLLHDRLARRPDGLRRRPRAAAPRSRKPGVLDLPVPLLPPGRAGGLGGGPGLAVHARPERQPRLVPACTTGSARTSSPNRSLPGTCRSSSR